MPCQEESEECKKSRADYNSAHQDLLVLQTTIANAKSTRNTGGSIAATGVGVIIAAVLVSNPIGWVILVGVAVASVGVGIGGTGSVQLIQERKKCAAASKKMYDAYNRANQYCKDAACVPPRPTQTCA